MTEAAIADIGHNNPPDAAALLREVLEDGNADLIKRTDDLLEAAERVPTIIDADNAGRVGDFIKQLTAANKHAEAKRKDAKEPHLEAGRVVDGFFKAISDPLDKEKKKITARLTQYQRAKADAERRQREAEARTAEEERRAAEQALEQEAGWGAGAKEEVLDDAVAAEERARDAAKEADAKPAELSRTRGDYGSVASLRTIWTGELADRDTLDLEALRPHFTQDALEKAIRTYVKTGGRNLRGAGIYEKSTTVVS